MRHWAFVLLAACSSEAPLRITVHPSILSIGGSVEVASDEGAELSVTGLPTSASASFGAAQDGRRTLTISGSAAPGDYALVVTARSGDRTASTPLDLVASSPAAAMISIEPQTIVIAQGGSATATARLAAPSAVPIDVRADSLPPWIAAAPFTIPAGQTEGTLRVSAGPEAPLGMQSFVVNGITVQLDVRHAVGGLDTSFGVGGLVVEKVLAQGQSPIDITSAVQQPDGKLVVVGDVYLGSDAYDVLVVRYDSEGNVDPTFGTNGVVTTDLGTSDYDVGSAVALQADGKIVVAGNHAYSEMAVIRYDSTGKLDPSFANAGVFRGIAGTTYSTGAYGVAIQNDGAIVISGLSSNVSKIVRLTSVGALDASFGSGGVLTGATGSFPAIVLQPDQKIVTAGWDASDFLVWRRNPDGTPDASFGANGAMTVDFAGSVDKGQSIALEKDGSILAGGIASQGASTFIGVAKLTPSGTLDATFGATGKSIVTASGEKGGALLVQPDGTILVGGGSSYNGTSSTVLARLTAAGGLDPSFDGTGLAFVSCGSHDQWWDTLVRQSDGRIVAVGFAGDPAKNTIMARFWP